MLEAQYASRANFSSGVEARGAAAGQPFRCFIRMMSCRHSRCDTAAAVLPHAGRGRAANRMPRSPGRMPEASARRQMMTAATAHGSITTILRHARLHLSPLAKLRWRPICPCPPGATRHGRRNVRYQHVDTRRYRRNLIYLIICRPCAYIK